MMLQRIPNISLKHRAAVSRYQRGMAVSDSSVRLGEIGAPFSTCQWIEGEPRDRQFCGAPTQSRSSYCPTHHARCYQAPAVEADASQAQPDSRGKP